MSSSYFRRAYKGLFTREDPIQLHKTLGISCLVSFVYRFVYVGAADMNFSAAPSTMLTLILHASLSISSLIFHIPTKRIVEGSRIWPEYRLHSIVFACRSLACMAVTWYELRKGVAAPMYFANALIVLSTLALADLGTWWVGEASRSSTIQDLHAPAAMRFFFSVMQFHATAGCLLGVRRFSVQFMYVWVIQFTAFLMTLRRKNLAAHHPLVSGYGIMLTAGFLVSMNDHLSVGAFALSQAMANFAACARLGLRMPKYVLWAGFAGIMHVARKTTPMDPHPALTPYAWVWPYAWFVSVLCVLAVGRKRLRAYGTKDKAAERVDGAAPTKVE